MSFARLVGLLLLLLVSTSCAHLEPSWGDREPPRVSLEDRKKDRESDEPSQQPQARGKPGDNATRVIQEIDQQTERFNAKLQSIISEGDKEKPQGESDQEKKVSGSATQQVSFNFYDADLVEVVRVFMDLLEADYMLHQNVNGRVSLSVDNAFTPEQLVDLLRGVLRINGAAMFEKNGVWEVLPLSEFPKHVSDEAIVEGQDKGKQRLGQVIQVFRLDYIAPSEMIKVIKPYLSNSATVYGHQDRGILLVSDFPHVLGKVDQLIDLFDESVFADIKAKAYTLKFANAEDTAQELEQIADTFGLSSKIGGPRGEAAFLALERTNMVLAITRDEQVLRFVDAWVHELDKELPETLNSQVGDNIFVYYVQYGDAQEIVNSMDGLFEEREIDSKDDDKGTPVGQKVKDGQQQDEAASSGQSMVSGQLSGPVTFKVDEATNSILTRASARDYSKILSVIEKLDLYPKQVLIEVVVAEVTHNDTTQLGVEWQYINDLLDDAVQNISLNSGLGAVVDMESPRISSGLSYLVTKTGRMKAAIKALAEKNLVQILSTPTLLASDNKEATINIGDEVPIPTTTERREDDTGGTVRSTTTLQYRDTGIILKVTPKINKQGMVRMDLSQEVSNLTDVNVENVSAPVISTRNAQTTVAVNDNETIVIGGLMEQQKTDNSSGVPGLSRLPILKHLFGYQSMSVQNTELIIFITPHVVLNEEDSRYITRDFLHRLEDIKKEMF